MNLKKINKLNTYLSTLNNFVPSKESDGVYSRLQQGISGGIDATMGTISQFHPLSGAIYQGAKLLNKGLVSLGGSTDSMTPQDAVFNSIPVIGTLNGFLGTKSNDFEIDKKIRKNIGSGFSGTFDDFEEIMKKAKKKYGILSSGSLKNTNNQITENKMKQDTLSKINDKVEDINDSINSDFQFRSDNYRKKVNGLNSNMYNFKFKEGGIIPEFEDGGKMNIIPEGALHSQKHNLEIEDHITKKGIPVVSTINGETIQHAEIERDEIILHIELTKKIEELSKDPTDENKIKVGELLVKEILYNTEDKTGLMSKIK